MVIKVCIRFVNLKAKLIAEYGRILRMCCEVFGKAVPNAACKAFIGRCKIVIEPSLACRNRRVFEYGVELREVLLDHLEEPNLGI